MRFVLIIERKKKRIEIGFKTRKKLIIKYVNVCIICTNNIRNRKNEMDDSAGLGTQERADFFQRTSRNNNTLPFDLGAQYLFF